MIDAYYLAYLRAMYYAGENAPTLYHSRIDGALSI
jgi:hypothetical protein